MLPLELSHDDLRQIGVERLQSAQESSSEKNGAAPSKKGKHVSVNPFSHSEFYQYINSPYITYTK